MSKPLSLPWPQGFHIAFTGIDGSGKSTQAGKLAFYMAKYGKTHFAEPRSDLASKLMHVLAKQHGGTGRREYFGDQLADFGKSFDVVRHHYGELLPLMVAGMHVVEPRSIFCRTAMALAMTGQRDTKTEQVLAMIPLPDLLFWVDTSPEVAHERVKVRGTDTEDLEELRKFSSAFKEMSESECWVRVDGDRTPEVIFEEIKGHVDRFFSTKRPK